MDTGDHGRRAVDLALAHVMRLAMNGLGTAAAATQLRRVVPSDAVLRRVRARLSRGLLERPGAIGERAVATIDAALALARPGRAPGGPSSSGPGPQPPGTADARPGSALHG